MSPPTVNAYYNPPDQRHQLPRRHPAAAVLRPPGRRRAQLRRHRRGDRPRADPRLRRQGRQFDADGNLNDWWTPRTPSEFEQRAQMHGEQYYGYTAVGRASSVNGRLTLGENVGRQRRRAHRLRGDARRARRAPGRSRRTASRRSSASSWATRQIWCQNITPEAAPPAAPDRPALARPSGASTASLAEHARVRAGVRLQAGPTRWSRANACRVW